MTEYLTPLSASLVSKWFVMTASRAEAHDLDNLKLQKLLFLAQCRHLAVTGQPLLREPVEAWKHGPVVSTVYHEYKEFGDAPINQVVSATGPWSHLTEAVTDTLVATWESFAVLSGWRLRDLTHDVGPWRDFFNAHQKHTVIPIEAICKAWPEFDVQSAKRGQSSLASVRLASLRERARATPLRDRKITPDLLLDELELMEETRREADSLVG